MGLSLISIPPLYLRGCFSVGLSREHYAAPGVVTTVNPTDSTAFVSRVDLGIQCFSRQPSPGGPR